MKKSLLFLFLLFATTLAAQDVLPDSTAITQDAPLLDRHRGIYYLGDQPLTEDEYRIFLMNNCPEAWNRYQAGKAMFISGISVFGLGVEALLLAGGGAFVGIWIDMIGDTNMLQTCGWIALGGGIAAVVGLPVFIVGSSMKRNAYEVYNESCLQTFPTKQQPQPQLELSLQASSNGLGLALRF
jgi:hypothetical protein